MVSIFDLLPKDTDSEQNKIAKILFSWAFNNADCDISEIAADLMPEQVTREQLPDNIKQAVVVWFLLYPKLDKDQYIDIIIDKLNFPPILVFYVNAITGRLDILKILKKNKPDVVKDLFHMGEADPHTYKFGCMHIKVLKWFKITFLDDFEYIFHANNYDFFNQACTYGQIETLEWITKLLEPNLLNQLITRSDFVIYFHVLKKGSFESAYWLLKNLSCFAFAESHFAEASKLCVTSFVQSQLDSLHKDSTQNRDQVFDITDSTRAQFCFYMLRNLIRRNDRSLDSELQFLLSIPAVRALAHKELSSQKPNELIQLALANGNIEAAEQLMLIEDVKNLTMHNNFYHDYLQAGPNFLKLLMWLDKSYPEILKQIIEIHASKLFIQAYKTGHFETLAWLEIYLKEGFVTLLKNESKNIITFSSKHGNDALLHWLKPKFSDSMQTILDEVGGESFVLACSMGHVEVLSWLKDNMFTESFEKLIKSHGYTAFKLACAHQHIIILDWFEITLSNVCEEWISRHDYEVLKQALNIGAMDTIFWLFQYPQTFAYADEKLAVPSLKIFIQGTLNKLAAECFEYKNHQQNILRSTSSFSSKQINGILGDSTKSNTNKRRVHFEGDSGTQDKINFPPFDIDYSERALLCFYIVRSIIRMNDEKLNKKLPFILAIPSVVALIRKDDARQFKALAVTVQNTLAINFLSQIVVEQEPEKEKQQAVRDTSVPTNAFFQPLAQSSTSPDKLLNEYK